MTRRLEEQTFTRDEWTRIVAPLPGLSAMQTWEYAEAKAATGPWKPVRAVVREGTRLIAAVQGIVRTIPFAGGGLLWINRGPLLAADDVSYESILDLIAQWASAKKWYVRVAPPRQELDDAALASAGFHATPVGGWCSSVVDLTVPADDLRKRLDQKWRNCLNKAVRLGVTVEAHSDDEALERYAADLEARLAEKPFETSVTPELLRAIQRLLPDDRKMTVFAATLEGKPLGANVMASFGDTAEYTSGVLLDEGRSVNAGHALLWTAMTTLQARGIRRFDVGGMHPERTPKGIFHFKEGVGGEFYCLANELESSRRDWRSAVIRWRMEKARAVS